MQMRINNLLKEHIQYKGPMSLWLGCLLYCLLLFDAPLRGLVQYLNIVQYTNIADGRTGT